MEAYDSLLHAHRSAQAEGMVIPLFLCAHQSPPIMFYSVNITHLMGFDGLSIS